jgi:hypothetical protein
MNDVRHAGACPSDGELEASGNMLSAGQVFFKGLNFVQAVYHKFNVIAGGEPKIAVAVLVCDVAEFTHILDRHESSAAYSDGENLVPAFCDVNQHAGFDDFMIFPFPVVLLNDGRKVLPEVARPKVRDPVFHGFLGIKPS